jgi:hypothetical protein
MRPLLLALVIAAWVARPGVAHAQSASDDVVPYAIVVGSNAAGPGQDDLRFAERDAARVAEVLRELGAYPAKHVRTVLAPSPATLLGAIDDVASLVAADQAAGRRTLVFFYYSGHARASGLVLGNQEVALDDLRARLTSLPATVTIVVLDACQSGAFTRVKGAEPAADFSYNASARFDAAGIAVMASSSASELSQESDFLEGSYFTHHLLVGLRGGGDRDRDGRVSLDEAYRYAYDQTLLATAQTAVGSQHVSLEVDLKGQGELSLTYPEKADATLTLAKEIAGEVLVERLPAEAVLAEVHKTAGATFDVAVPAGRYRVLVRTAKVVRRCPVEVRPGGATVVDLGGCDEMALVQTGAKHGVVLSNVLAIELGAAVGSIPDDAFTRRLDAFGYHSGTARGALSLGLIHRVLPHVAATARLARITGETWTRDTEDKDDPLTYEVTSYLVTLGGRGELATASDRAMLWVEAGAGVTWSRDRFEDEQDVVSKKPFWGAHLAAGAGATWYPRFLGRFGADLSARWLYAPTVDNLVGDQMDVGGFFVGLGLTYRVED